MREISTIVTPFLSHDDKKNGNTTNQGRIKIGLPTCDVAYSCMSRAPRKFCMHYGTCRALRGFFMPDDNYLFDNQPVPSRLSSEDNKELLEYADFSI